MTSKLRPACLYFQYPYHEHPAYCMFFEKCLYEDEPLCQDCDEAVIIPMDGYEDYFYL